MSITWRGTSILAYLASEFWKFCLNENIHVQAGLHNEKADWYSRHLSDTSDWQLDLCIFHRLSDLWGPFETNMFVSRTNTQLPRYFSWHPIPGQWQRVLSFGTGASVSFTLFPHSP